MDRRAGEPLLIDCSTCPVQHVGCADCMVTALVAPEAVAGPQDLPLDPGEREVVSLLVRSGLVDAETAAGARAVREPLPLHRGRTREAG